MTNVNIPAELYTQNSITFYEHPVHGSDVPVLVKVSGKYYDTSFYDPDDSDMEYIIDMINEIKTGAGNHEPVKF